jgi:glucose/arabinose dehydrogenase
MINKLLLCMCILMTACSVSAPQAVSTPAPTSVETPTQQSITTPSQTATEPRPTETPPATSAAEILPTPTMERLGFPDPAKVQWKAVASGLTRPVGLANASDASNRLFIIEQVGLIRVLEKGQLSPVPFLDIRDRVGSQSNEQGLLGLAFHPHFAETGFFYVNYTDLQGNTVISRFQAPVDTPLPADTTSEKRLLSIDQPYPNHNGGSVVFGPDGYLYLGLGDGGSAGDPQSYAQSKDTLLGKILRLDVDHGDPYTIPPDNPFASGGGRPEIWSYGLRNPWRFSFDRQTGNLFIGDVGQDQWEEIDFLPAGSPGGGNLGWDFMEGTHPYEGAPPSDLVGPIFEYNHYLGCSVTGGYVYRGQHLPEWRGVYLFADYCTGNVWGLIPGDSGIWASQILFTNVGRVSSFGEDEDGEIYLLDHGGIVYQLTNSAP